MKRISLDSVLLFTFVVPFIMTYRLSWGETPYWLFGLIFLAMLLYIALDLFAFKHLYSFLKHITLWILIVTVIGSAFVSAIIVRHQTAPVYSVHDIILQQEAAIRFTIHGQNPYAVTYFNTPLAQWHYSDKEVNPALYHFVMEPFYVLFATPFYFLSNHVFGFFDGRIPLLFLFMVLLASVDRFTSYKNNKLLFLTLLAFNPAMLGYTLEGRSDIFMYAFLILGFILLTKKKYALAGVPIGLAFAVKQSAWPLLPFYIAYLYFKTKSISKVVLAMLPFIVMLLSIILPFFFWNAKAFIDSTILYLSGGGANSYPISGYGIGMILKDMGIISDSHHYFPFHILQVIVGIPMLVVLLKFLKQSITVNRLILVYGIFLLVFWYFSRYFNNSHLAFLSMVFITAYFWPEEEFKKT